MRILQINKFNFSKGGADKHFLDLIELLKSKGHEVAVFSMRYPDNRPSDWSKYFLSYVGYNKNDSGLWEKIKGAGRMFYSFEAKQKINALLNEFKPDIVHIHNIYHQLSPIILFEIKKRKIPTIMTVHDYKLINPNYNLFHNGKFYNRCKNGKYYQCFLDKCVKNSYLKSFIAALEMYWHNKILKTYKKNIDLYIAPSLFARNILSDGGVDGRKIEILPHFIKSSNTVFQYTGVKKKLYALYFGRISREKGIDKLIGIFESLNGIKLYLAGSVEDGLKIDNLKNAEYLGFLGQEELRKYIENSKFVISGSRLPETFGLVALEAIAQGKPFISFNAGAYSEIIQNGVNGYLANSEKELEETIKNVISGKIIFNSEKIKKEALEKYNSEKFYQIYLTLLERFTLHKVRFRIII